MSNPDLIRPLADNVINQIAAGEVIERPASIVKELLENSLDAGASRVNVELSDGGIEHIQVRDDGRGIPADQLHLALSRHCTSKLVDASELGSIASLGFRGEALASISSVAEITIVSRTLSDAHGWRVDMQPGTSASEPRPQAHALGTTIDVRGLFATTPVRRRFLKQPRTEFLHIQQFIRRAGFCYPEVAFGLVHDAKQNLSLPAPQHAASVERRWRVLFGGEFVDNALLIDFPADEVYVRGWAGNLAYSRQNSDLQYIGINRRIVRDRHIAHAVRMAYADSIEDGRQPAYALHLDMPTSGLDVNVHPGKAEVRFRDPRSVHDIVYAAVKQALGGTDWAVSSPSVYPVATDSAHTIRIAEKTGRANSYNPQRVAAAPPKPLTATDEALLAITGHRFAFADDNGSIFATDLYALISAVVAARLTRGERDARPLIIPETINAELSDDTIDTLAKFGIELGRLGEDSVVLRAVPIVTSEIDQRAFGASIIATLAAGKTEIEAIATAAAVAFRTPQALAERRRWFSNLTRQLPELELRLADFSVDLAPDVLSRLFASRQT